jgi:hypothetical protein
MSNIGSSKIAEMYVGSTKIARAYVGSDLVFQISQPAEVYDSYKVHLTWSNTDNFNMAGLKINGVQATTTQVTSLWRYLGGWNEESSSNKDAAIQWDNNDNGVAFYGKAIDINFTSDDGVSSVRVKTGTWYGGGSMTVTMHVAGVKDGVETDLGYTSQTNAASLIYTVNI